MGGALIHELPRIQISGRKSERSQNAVHTVKLPPPRPYATARGTGMHQKMTSRETVTYMPHDTDQEDYHSESPLLW